ncbi:uncharacterized protein E0L32_006254 [Thyridium curvatum]|uniref:Uncharacterized protein n=1 Tax=Thyridium curvatum TaxID=1093900 RepID=A0A507B880_9PEZI|nr:uncharacterized protein E0L32_006254 [Thyridium curvatum]TPX13281.1 hypothetical protein E0L32_006254 [Thyridium curvatum]
MASSSSSSPQPLPAYAKYTHFLTTSPAPFVAHVEINRPRKLNSFYEAMWLELSRLFAQLSHDPDVRAVVLSGAGDRAFTTGLDVQAASQGPLVAARSPDGPGDPARAALALRRHIDEFQSCVSAVERCDKPVVAAVHGVAWGLAIDIACCADVRLAAADASFSVKEVDIGLAADIGTLSRLPKCVGSASWVKDVCLSARVFDAREALAQGFVSRVLESKAACVAAAVQTASLLASKSPVAVQGTKEILNHARDHTVAESLRYTMVWNGAALQSKDVPEALMSGLKKTKPRFEKL